MSRTRTTTLIAALTASIGIALLPAMADADATTPVRLDRPGCVKQLLAEPTPTQKVRLDSPAAFRSAAAANGRPASKMAALAADRTLWLDRCGRAFYVDEAVPMPPRASAPAQAGPRSLASEVPDGTDVMALESRPGAARTIYLDFTGGMLTGTAWNEGLGDLYVPPFSTDSTVSTSFSPDERLQIFRAYSVVAEDYAPFEVNVTTKDPGPDALARVSTADAEYGTRVLVANAGPIYDECGCGGIAYLDVFGMSGSIHDYYQPAWVFADGVARDGYNIGDAASHEAGHNLGLNHDGNSTYPYEVGAQPWAPIMGVSYRKPLSQWSAGEYPDANNREDDLAVIATHLPNRSDDYPDTATDAALLAADVPLHGVIATRDDVDAFTFTASGPTRLAVAPEGLTTNLDVLLRIVDADGTELAVRNPDIDPDTAGPGNAPGTGAEWDATLPDTPATYTAFVDGVQAPATSAVGHYSASDYGSLGRYTITLTALAPPLSLTSAGTIRTVVGHPLGAVTTATVSGGTAPFRWTATAPPPGLDFSDGILSGTATQPSEDWPITVTVTDAHGETASTQVQIVVDPEPVVVEPPTTTPAPGFATKSLPAARVKKRYKTLVRLSNPTPGIVWSVSKTLPRGLRLVQWASGATAVIKGTPRKAGRYAFKVAITDTNGKRVVRRYTLRVRRP